MPAYILPIIALFFLLICYITFRPEALAAKYALKSALAGQPGQELARQYRKRLIRSGIVFLLLIVPLVLLQLFVPQYASFPLLYLFVWIAGWVWYYQFQFAPAYINSLRQIDLNQKEAGKSASPVIDTKTKIGLAVASLVLAAALAATFHFEFSGMTVNFNNDEVEINAPMYDISFSTNDIKSVVMIPVLPNGSKNNGFASNKVAYGHFNLDGVGPCEVYVHHGVRKYIMVTLKDKVIFLNGETPEETDEYYRKLLGLPPLD